MTTAFFTGHRSIKSNEKNIKGINKLIDFAIDKGVENFLVGMAIGGDLLSAEILSERKLNWIAVIPCGDQTKLWNQQDKNRYKIIDYSTDRIILYEKYQEGVMQSRNNYMVINSDICLAIWDGSSKGGTALTVQMAIKNHKPIYQFNPKTNQFNLIQSQQLNLF